MGKGVRLIGLVLAMSLGFGACTAFKRPVRSRTLEPRPMAPTKQEQIRAQAAEAEAAAAEMFARMQRESR